MVSFPPGFFADLHAEGYRATADVTDSVFKRLPGVTLRWSIDVFERITLRGTAQDVEVSRAWTDNDSVVDMEARVLRMLQVEPAAVQPTDAETAKVRLRELQALEAATEELLATYRSESAGLRRKFAIERVRLTGLCRHPDPAGRWRLPPGASPGEPDKITTIKELRDFGYDLKGAKDLAESLPGVLPPDVTLDDPRVVRMQALGATFDTVDP